MVNSKPLRWTWVMKFEKILFVQYCIAWVNRILVDISPKNTCPFFVNLLALARKATVHYQKSCFQDILILYNMYFMRSGLNIIKRHKLKRLKFQSLFIFVWADHRSDAIGFRTQIYEHQNRKILQVHYISTNLVPSHSTYTLHIFSVRAHSCIVKNNKSNFYYN